MKQTPLSRAQNIVSASETVAGDWFHSMAICTQSKRERLLGEYTSNAVRRGEVVAADMKSLGYKLRRTSFSTELKLRESCSFVFSAQNFIFRDESIEQPTIIVSSHADYRAGAGAVDNASGLAIMASVAEALRKTKASVWFIAFGAEEVGLGGSKHFLREEKIPKPKANINIDSVGKGELCNVPVKVPSTTCLYYPSIDVPLRSIYADIDSDASSFGNNGIRASTISTHEQSPEMATYPPPLHMSSTMWHKGNVCNSQRDTLDALDAENMQQAVVIAVDAVLRLHKEFSA